MPLGRPYGGGGNSCRRPYSGWDETHSDPILTGPDSLFAVVAGGNRESFWAAVVTPVDGADETNYT